MKILYGVQGTGNGHITRARAMQKEFAKTDIQVDYLFSGRKKSDYFDMDCFENKLFKKGLTFSINNGKVKYIQTALNSNLIRFKKDINQLNMSSYDVVITDFEPITARCGKKAGIPVIGLGHQYVFNLEVPQVKSDYFSKRILNDYAPAERIIPLHWHPFNQNILPPILENHSNFQNQSCKNLVVVYLPFENQKEVFNSLKLIKHYQFIIYSPKPLASQCPHISFKTLSRWSFLNDLHRCETVIANAGFELSSEALMLGKKLIVKPLNKQVEQQSNAIALKQLGYGWILNQLNTNQILTFLTHDVAVQINFPNVAKSIVDWASQGFPKRDKMWYENIWKNVKVRTKSHQNDKKIQKITQVAI